MGLLTTPEMSYSGADISVYAAVTQSVKQADDTYKNKKVFQQLAEIQTLSYSVYREKEGVKVLGRSAMNGFTRGYYTIAGTMVFTVFKQRVLNELMGHSINEIDYSDLRIDQLPPLDVFVSFFNELGDESRLAIYGVEFMNEGQVMSVQDLITENSVNYVARHLSPMRKISTDITPKDYLERNFSDNTIGSPITIEEYDKVKEELKKSKKYIL